MQLHARGPPQPSRSPPFLPDTPRSTARSVQSFPTPPCSTALPTARRGSVRPRMGSSWRQDSGVGWRATPLHAGAPHLGSGAPWRRGTAPWRQGGRTAMSEEQVSRCHTHSGVAESTMCVSQWLTCSWRVTGGGGPTCSTGDTGQRE